eukprot:tig00001057_g6695.t1
MRVWTIPELEGETVPLVSDFINKKTRALNSGETPALFDAQPDLHLFYRRASDTSTVTLQLAEMADGATGVDLTTMIKRVSVYTVPDAAKQRLSLASGNAIKMYATDGTPVPLTASGVKPGVVVAVGGAFFLSASSSFGTRGKAAEGRDVYVSWSITGETGGTDLPVFNEIYVELWEEKTPETRAEWTLPAKHGEVQFSSLQMFGLVLRSSTTYCVRVWGRYEQGSLTAETKLSIGSLSSGDVEPADEAILAKPATAFFVAHGTTTMKWIQLAKGATAVGLTRAIERAMGVEANRKKLRIITDDGKEVQPYTKEATEIPLAKTPAKPGSILSVTDLGAYHLSIGTSSEGPMYVSWSLNGQPSDAKAKPKLAHVMVELWTQGAEGKREGLWKVPACEGNLVFNQVVLHWGTMKPSTQYSMRVWTIPELEGETVPLVSDFINKKTRALNSGETPALFDAQPDLHLFYRRASDTSTVTLQLAEMADGATGVDLTTMIKRVSVYTVPDAAKQRLSLASGDAIKMYATDGTPVPLTASGVKPGVVVAVGGAFFLSASSSFGTRGKAAEGRDVYVSWSITGETGGTDLPVFNEIYVELWEEKTPETRAEWTLPAKHGEVQFSSLQMFGLVLRSSTTYCVRVWGRYEQGSLTAETKLSIGSLSSGDVEPADEAILAKPAMAFFVAHGTTTMKWIQLAKGATAVGLTRAIERAMGVEANRKKLRIITDDGKEVQPYTKEATEIPLAKTPAKSGSILSVTDLGAYHLSIGTSSEGPMYVSWSLNGQPSDAKAKPKLAHVMVELWTQGAEGKREGLWKVPACEGNLVFNQVVLHWGTMKPSTQYSMRVWTIPELEGETVPLVSDFINKKTRALNSGETPALFDAQPDLHLFYRRASDTSTVTLQLAEMADGATGVDLTTMIKRVSAYTVPDAAKQRLSLASGNAIKMYATDGTPVPLTASGVKPGVVVAVGGTFFLSASSSFGTRGKAAEGRDVYVSWSITGETGGADLPVFNEIYVELWEEKTPGTRAEWTLPAKHAEVQFSSLQMFGLVLRSSTTYCVRVWGRYEQGSLTAETKLSIGSLSSGDVEPADEAILAKPATAFFVAHGTTTMKWIQLAKGATAVGLTRAIERAMGVEANRKKLRIITDDGKEVQTYTKDATEILLATRPPKPSGIKRAKREKVKAKRANPAFDATDDVEEVQAGHLGFRLAENVRAYAEKQPDAKDATETSLAETVATPGETELASEETATEMRAEPATDATEAPAGEVLVKPGTILSVTDLGVCYLKPTVNESGPFYVYWAIEGQPSGAKEKPKLAHVMVELWTQGAQSMRLGLWKVPTSEASVVFDKVMLSWGTIKPSTAYGVRLWGIPVGETVPLVADVVSKKTRALNSGETPALFDAQPKLHFFYRRAADSSPAAIQLVEVADGATGVDLRNSIKRLSTYTVPDAAKQRLSLSNGDPIKMYATDGTPVPLSASGAKPGVVVAVGETCYLSVSCSFGSRSKTAEGRDVNVSWALNDKAKDPSPPAFTKMYVELWEEKIPEKRAEWTLPAKHGEPPVEFSALQMFGLVLRSSTTYCVRVWGRYEQGSLTAETKFSIGSLSSGDTEPADEAILAKPATAFFVAHGTTTMKWIQLAKGATAVGLTRAIERAMGVEANRKKLRIITDDGKEVQTYTKDATEILLATRPPKPSGIKRAKREKVKAKRANPAFDATDDVEEVQAGHLGFRLAENVRAYAEKQPDAKDATETSLAETVATPGETEPASEETATEMRAEPATDATEAPAGEVLVKPGTILSVTDLGVCYLKPTVNESGPFYVYWAIEGQPSGAKEKPKLAHVMVELWTQGAESMRLGLWKVPTSEASVVFDKVMLSWGTIKPSTAYGVRLWGIPVGETVPLVADVVSKKTRALNSGETPALFDAQPKLHFFYRRAADSSPAAIQLVEVADGATGVDLRNSIKRLSAYTVPDAAKQRLLMSNGDPIKMYATDGTPVPLSASGAKPGVVVAVGETCYLSVSCSFGSRSKTAEGRDVNVSWALNDKAKDPSPPAFTKMYVELWEEKIPEKRAEWTLPAKHGEPPVEFSALQMFGLVLRSSTTYCVRVWGRYEQGSLTAETKFSIGSLSSGDTEPADEAILAKPAMAFFVAHGTTTMKWIQLAKGATAVGLTRAIERAMGVEANRKKLRIITDDGKEVQTYTKDATEIPLATRPPKPSGIKRAKREKVKAKRANPAFDATDDVEEVQAGHLGFRLAENVRAYAEKQPDAKDATETSLAETVATPGETEPASEETATEMRAEPATDATEAPAGEVLVKPGTILSVTDLGVCYLKPTVNESGPFYVYWAIEGQPSGAKEKPKLAHVMVELWTQGAESMRLGLWKVPTSEASVVFDKVMLSWGTIKPSTAYGVRLWGIPVGETVPLVADVVSKKTRALNSGETPALFDAQPKLHFFYRRAADSSPAAIQLVEVADGATGVDLRNSIKRLSAYTVPDAAKQRLLMSNGDPIKMYATDGTPVPLSASGAKPGVVVAVDETCYLSVSCSFGSRSKAAEGRDVNVSWALNDKAKDPSPPAFTKMYVELWEEKIPEKRAEWTLPAKHGEPPVEFSALQMFELVLRSSTTYCVRVWGRYEQGSLTAETKFTIGSLSSGDTEPADEAILAKPATAFFVAHGTTTMKWIQLAKGATAVGLTRAIERAMGVEANRKKLRIITDDGKEVQPYTKEATEIPLAKTPAKPGSILSVTDLGAYHLSIGTSSEGPMYVSWSLNGQPSGAKAKPKLAHVMVELWTQGAEGKREGLWKVPACEGNLVFNQVVLHWGTMKPSTQYSMRVWTIPELEGETVPLVSDFINKKTRALNSGETPALFDAQPDLHLFYRRASDTSTVTLQLAEMADGATGVDLRNAIKRVSVHSVPEALRQRLWLASGEVIKMYDKEGDGVLVSASGAKPGSVVAVGETCYLSISTSYSTRGKAAEGRDVTVSWSMYDKGKDPFDFVDISVEMWEEKTPEKRAEWTLPTKHNGVEFSALQMFGLVLRSSTTYCVRVLHRYDQGSVVGQAKLSIGSLSSGDTEPADEAILAKPATAFFVAHGPTTLKWIQLSKTATGLHFNQAVERAMGLEVNRFKLLITTPSSTNVDVERYAEDGAVLPLGSRPAKSGSLLTIAAKKLCTISSSLGSDSTRPLTISWSISSGDGGEPPEVTIELQEFEKRDRRFAWKVPTSDNSTRTGRLDFVWGTMRPATKYIVRVRTVDQGSVVSASELEHTTRPLKSGEAAPSWDRQPAWHCILRRHNDSSPLYLAVLELPDDAPAVDLLTEACRGGAGGLLAGVWEALGATLAIEARYRRFEQIAIVVQCYGLAERPPEPPDPAAQIFENEFAHTETNGYI